MLKNDLFLRTENGPKHWAFRREEATEEVQGSHIKLPKHNDIGHLQREVSSVQKQTNKQKNA